MLRPLHQWLLRTKSRSEGKNDEMIYDVVPMPRADELDF